jgi:hypothetical protein
MKKTKKLELKRLTIRSLGSVSGGLLLFDQVAEPGDTGSDFGSLKCGDPQDQGTMVTTSGRNGGVYGSNNAC